jgi:hypothetical protein
MEKNLPSYWNNALMIVCHMHVKCQPPHITEWLSVVEKNAES